MAKTDYSKLSQEELIKLVEEKDAELTIATNLKAKAEGELQTKVAEMKLKDADLVTSKEVIADLKSVLEAKEEEILTASSVPTVKIGKDTYEIVIPEFGHYDTDSREYAKYTARDVQKDEKLAAALVKSGSGVLVKIVKK